MAQTRGESLIRGVYAGTATTATGTRVGACSGASRDSFGQRQEVVMVVPDAVNRALGNGRDPRIGVTVDV
jgi:hypothetical protein